MKTHSLSKANNFLALFITCAIIFLSGCSTAKPELKLGTYKITVDPPAQFHMTSHTRNECVIEKDLEVAKAYPGPVPRSQPMCPIRNYRIDGEHISYKQLCKDDKNMAGGDLLINWDFVLNDHGYVGSMKSTFPGETTEVQTHIRAEYLREGCHY